MKTNSPWQQNTEKMLRRVLRIKRRGDTVPHGPLARPWAHKISFAGISNKSTNLFYTFCPSLLCFLYPITLQVEIVNLWGNMLQPHGINSQSRISLLANFRFSWQASRLEILKYLPSILSQNHQSAVPYNANEWENHQEFNFHYGTSFICDDCNYNNDNDKLLSIGICQDFL